MKKTLLLTLLLFLTLPSVAQSVFRLAYATSPDGFVNVRTTPSSKSKVLSKVLQFNHGLGNAVVLSTSGAWTKVMCQGKTGYAYTKYLGFMDWYKSSGSARLVAKSDTPVYVENLRDGGIGEMFCVIKSGTIIADSNFSRQGDYYVLQTAHDNLFVPAKNVQLVNP